MSTAVEPAEKFNQIDPPYTKEGGDDAEGEEDGP